GGAGRRGGGGGAGDEYPRGEQLSRHGDGREGEQTHLAGAVGARLRPVAIWLRPRAGGGRAAGPRGARRGGRVGRAGGGAGGGVCRDAATTASARGARTGGLHSVAGNDRPLAGDLRD